MASIGTGGSNPILNVPHATHRSTSKVLWMQRILLPQLPCCSYFPVQVHRLLCVSLFPAPTSFAARIWISSELASLAPSTLAQQTTEAETAAAGRNKRNRNSGHFLTPPSSPSSLTHHTFTHSLTLSLLLPSLPLSLTASFHAVGVPPLSFLFIFIHCICWDQNSMSYMFVADSHLEISARRCGTAVATRSVLFIQS